jgi:2-oxoisovalerate dehydrogenase E2 component (dihydrolipoyl transacylase)
MKRDFILPDIGEGIVECEVIEWKVKEGDVIVEDQIIVEVSTDKAIVEIPSMYNGRVTHLFYTQGEIAKVNAPLFSLEVDNIEGSTMAMPENQPEDRASNLPAPAQSIAVVPMNIEKVLSTPAVRKMAREHELDLAAIVGTGKQGRVLKEDVLDYLSVNRRVPVPQLAANVGDRIEPIKGVRKIMGERMSEAVSTIPHFTYMDEIDVTELMQTRQLLKETYGSDDLKMTLMPLFIKALSLAMKDFPIINSRINDDCTELTYIASHNIGMAVDGQTGLLLPNIKNVQTLGLLAVAREVTRLTEAARSGKINTQELVGGTVTISNIGAIGGTVATPIIPKPCVAIVALGKIQTLPRFDDQGNVVARKIMTVSWSGDHRVIDGGTIARFNNHWTRYLENPALMLAVMT